MPKMWVFLLLAACGGSQPVSSTPPAPVAPTFLQMARAVVPAPFEGTVALVVPAGSYTYLQVATSPDEARWVVVLRREVSVGDPLTVRPYGQLDDFVSPATGLAFDQLVFASITPGSV